jgi:hypothetical protein
MVLRLSYWRVLRRPEASRPSLASLGSTGAGTGRSGALKLANAASRIGNGSLVRPQATRSDRYASREPARAFSPQAAISDRGAATLRTRRPSAILVESGTIANFVQDIAA